MELIISTSHKPAFNLAIEEYLFSRCEGEYAFFYCNNPCVVIGSNQVWQNEVDVAFCEQNGIAVLRRLSGGGAVYHDRGNLNYSFITHKTSGNSGTTADFLHPVVEALLRMGIMAIIGKRKDLWLPDGYKISGTASHVTMNRVLQHGTLLYDSNIEMLKGALNPPKQLSTSKGIPSVPSPVKNIMRYLIEKSSSSYTGFLGANAFFNQLILEMTNIMNLLAGHEFTEAELSAIQTIQSTRYESENWNLKK
ncbi:MAG: lipoate--protein ligase family protein [Paludibacter sp.]|jgi:lipoate-protein ligase A|nr:lipoate--protein ligase family protein [Paludibacter sp.]